MRYLAICLLLLVGGCTNSPKPKGELAVDERNQPLTAVADDSIPERLIRPDGTYRLLTGDDFYVALAELQPYTVIEFRGHKYVRDNSK